MSSWHRSEEAAAGPNFQQYYESYYRGLHAWRDYERVSMGFGGWYYDCLPGDRDARILDIGCGDGKFLFFLKRKGYRRMEGVELSAELADIASRRVGCTVHAVQDTLAFLNGRRESYDTIAMNDVLEHIPKEATVGFLAAVKAALAPGGNLVVNVPQASGFTSLYCRYNDFTHRVVFTEMSLRQVLVLGGFHHVRFIAEKWPLKLTPRHLSYRLLRRVWFSVLRLIYFIEQPYEIVPRSFQIRIVAEAR